MFVNCFLSRHHCDGIGPDLIKEGIGMMDEIKDIRTFEWHRILKVLILIANLNN